jgi:hypothetical protein
MTGNLERRRDTRTGEIYLERRRNGEEVKRKGVRRGFGGKKYHRPSSVREGEKRKRER